MRELIQLANARGTAQHRLCTTPNRPLCRVLRSGRVVYASDGEPQRLKCVGCFGRARSNGFDNGDVPIEYSHQLTGFRLLE